MTNADILPVLKIQRFSVKDGDGIRTTVFLKGCPLCCKWCHNPESQEVKREFFYLPSLCINCRRCESVCENGAHSFLKGAHEILRDKCNLCLKCCSNCVTDALEPVYKNYKIDEIVKEVLKDKLFYQKSGGMTLSGGEPLFHGEKTLKLIEAVKKEGVNIAIETSGFFDGVNLSELVKYTDCFLWDIKLTDGKNIENIRALTTS